jgi:cytochrome d ubiquinol oxidase subunit I
MRFADAVVVVVARTSGEVVPARAQMATTLGFHIILACLGIALPTIVLLAEFIGLRRPDPVAMTLARRWSQAMGVLVVVGAVTGTVLSFEMGLLWPGLMRRYGAVLGLPFGIEGLFSFWRPSSPRSTCTAGGAWAGGRIGGPGCRSRSAASSARCR